MHDCTLRLQARNFLAGGEVPDPERAVALAGDDTRAVRRHDQVAAALAALAETAQGGGQPALEELLLGIGRERNGRVGLQDLDGPVMQVGVLRAAPFPEDAKPQPDIVPRDVLGGDAAVDKMADDADQNGNRDISRNLRHLDRGVQIEPHPSLPNANARAASQYASSHPPSIPPRARPAL